MQLLRLVLPVVSVILISLFALVMVAVIFAARHDRSAKIAETAILENAIEKVTERLFVLAEDNAWWDEAVTNVVLKENLDWISLTFGDIAPSRSNVDGTLVIRPDSSVMYRAEARELPPQVTGWLQAGMQKAIDELKPINENFGVSTWGYILYEGQIIALGISMLQPTQYEEYDPPLGTAQRPVLIFYEYMNKEEYIALENDAGIRDLSFTQNASDQMASLPLYDITNKPIGFLQWAPKTPGQELLDSLIIPATIFLLIILAAMALFVRQARQLISNLEQADRAKMSFLASMSHEVRTPLNTIIGFAEIVGLELYGKLEGEKNKEYMKIIRTSGEHLLSIINDILDISKLESDRFEVFAEPLETDDIIEQCLQMIQVTAEDHNIRLVTETTNTTLRGDERIMRQAIINILSNAVKFTPKGGQVSIRTEQKDNSFSIIITDNGPGIKEEDIKTALAPFGQIRSNDTKSYGGTGLGLPLVDRFMKLIGGTMTIRSAHGHGTSVTLQFPLVFESGKSAAFNELLPK